MKNSPGLLEQLRQHLFIYFIDRRLIGSIGEHRCHDRLKRAWLDPKGQQRIALAGARHLK